MMTATTIALGAKMRPGQQNDPRILVDPEDAWLLEYKWYIWKPDTKKVPYARHTINLGTGTRSVLLHRIIVGAAEGECVDHINHDGLDNRRSNLRRASPRQNTANQRLSCTNTSGYKGVLWDRRAGKWLAQIKRNQKIGRYDSPEAAARAYDQRAIELYGEFALTNESLGLYPWQKDEAAD